MIKAEIICDSISREGKRITTFKLRYQKFIHGEFMTHRTISRNASSSRAIPTAKYLEEVRSDVLRAAPVFWGKNQKGMQAAEELSDEVGMYGQSVPANGKFGQIQPASEFSAKQAAHIAWGQAAADAARRAEYMEKIGLHKQIVNRILEPFLHINVVATATEWDNFFGLRLHKDAQPEMRALAEAMWEVRQASTPTLRHPGAWHLPFIQDEYIDDFLKVRLASSTEQSICDDIDDIIQVLIKSSVARCARVSYESFETGRHSTVEEDLALYEKLTAGLSDPSQPLHASPMEHQATPDVLYKGGEAGSRWQCRSQHGNFVGWRQYRKMLPGEACAPLPGGY